MENINSGKWIGQFYSTFNNVIIYYIIAWYNIVIRNYIYKNDMIWYDITAIIYDNIYYNMIY